MPAALAEVLDLLQLFLPEVAAHQRVAVLVDTIEACPPHADNRLEALSTHLVATL